MITLESLHAKACRGILDGPTLLFSAGGSIICGDNGTGKSSFVDAIEKVMTGRCGSVDIGSQTVSWNKHGVRISSGTPEIDLVLNDSGRSIPLSLDTDLSKLPKNVRAFMEAARQQSFILRRRTLLRYVDARDNAERYKAIEEFLNLDGYQRFEEMLKTLSTEKAAKLSLHEQSVKATETALQQQLGLPRAGAVDERACITALNGFLSSSGVAIVRDLAEAVQRMGEVKRDLSTFKDMDAAKNLFLLSEKADAIPAAKQLLEAAQLYATKKLSEESEAAKLKGSLYEAVLKEGVDWIRADNLKQCPLCLNSIDPQEVIREVEERLKEHGELRRLRVESDKCWRDFMSALAAYRAALADVGPTWTKVIGQELPAKAKSAMVCLKGLVDSCQAQKPSKSFGADLDALLAADLDDVRSELGAALEKKRRLTPDYNRYSALLDAATKLTITISSLNSLAEQRDTVARARKISSYAKTLHGCSVQARKDAVQKLLDDVADLAHRYLTEIHQNDKIGSPTLTVLSRGSASVELTSEFHGISGDPRGHFSEGHIDSLGLCLFLAIRRIHHSQQPQLALLILDDVLHSVDGEHRLATANLIFKEFSDHQIIITTHDPLWFENLKMAQSALAPARKFTRYRIADWSIDQGPTWGDHLSDYEWLCSEEGRKGKPADRVVKAGRLLEELLRHLCHGLRSAVSFDITGRYTVDPLWSAFLKSASGNKGFVSANGATLDAIDVLRQQRNWVGAHWNDWAQSLTVPESKQFSDAVVALRGAAYCAKCNAFVKRIGDLNGIWSCPNGCLTYRSN